MKITLLSVSAIFFQIIIGFWVISKLGFYGNDLWQNHFLEYFTETVVGISIIIILFKFKKLGIILSFVFILSFVLRLYVIPLLTGNID